MQGKGFRRVGSSKPKENGKLVSVAPSADAWTHTDLTDFESNGSQRSESDLNPTEVNQYK